MKLTRLAAIIGALPETLTNGTTADATEVMADLNWIVNQVNANAADAALVALTAANNNFTAVQSGVAATAAANFPIASQVQDSVFMTLSSTLGTNSITGRIAALALGAYGANKIFTFIPSQTNTGAAQINIDTVGNRAIQAFGSALVGGELKQGVPAQIVDDGTRFQLLPYQIPAGVIMPFGGATTPTGFLLCDGAATSRAAFRDLFAAIGTTWGAGDGSTTFNVPDLRGRALFGRDNMGGTTASRITNAVAGIVGTTLGATGGDQQLSQHLHAAGTLAGDSHVHSTDTTGTVPTTTGSGTPGSNNVVQEVSDAANSTAPITIGSATTGGATVTISGSTANTGANTISQNIPPAAIVNYIIKY